MDIRPSLGKTAMFTLPVMVLRKCHVSGSSAKHYWNNRFLGEEDMELSGDWDPYIHTSYYCNITTPTNAPLVSKI